MSSQYSGFGSTVDEALTAASEAALNDWVSINPDALAVVTLDSVHALYGGFVGHVGTRLAIVSIGDGKSLKGAEFKESPSSQLVLSLEAVPNPVWVNLQPGPGPSGPQERRVALILTVTNIGDATFSGQSPDGAVVKYSAYVNGEKVWNHPILTTDAVTLVDIAPKESRSYNAVWIIPDARGLVGAEILAVANFVPSGQAATISVEIKAAV